MSDSSQLTKRVLEPIERISELLFGLIMVLTLTGSFSVADSGRDQLRGMLLSALGCNLIWGIIDAVLYLMGCLAERSRRRETFHAVRRTDDPEHAMRLIAEELPQVVANLLKPSEFAELHHRLKQLPELPRRVFLSKRDWLGSLGVFLWVFLSMFPVVIPFIFMGSTLPALRVSNAIAVVMLFLTGYAFGRCAGRNPWLVGLGMVLVGAALVALTIALGG